MKIAIFTEDMGLSTQLEGLFLQYGKQADISMQVCKTARMQQLMETVSFMSPDICFVDLETEKGREAAEYIYLTDESCTRYLIDGDNKNSLFGYQVAARDFLIKPVEDALFYKIVLRETKNCSERPKYIKVKFNGLWKAMMPEKVMYVESVGHSLIFHMVSGDNIKFVASFKEYHPTLNAYENFFRCHQSYIINLDYVLEMKNDMFYLANDEKINISRQYRKESKQYFTNYMIKKYYGEI